MLVPVLPKELSVFPQPATNPVWPERKLMPEAVTEKHKCKGEVKLTNRREEKNDQERQK